MIECIVQDSWGQKLIPALEVWQFFLLILILELVKYYLNNRIN